MKALKLIKDFLKFLIPFKEDPNTAEVLFSEAPPIADNGCSRCPLREKCKEHEYGDDCAFIATQEFDDKKGTFLIIDDNPGIVSYLREDIEFLINNKIFKKDYNILSFCTDFAAFNFELFQRKTGDLNIKYAILDITLAGSITTDQGILKYTGVDIYRKILEYNPAAKVIFYTGNNLNPYIRANLYIIKAFKELTNKDINDFIIYKTSLNMDDRRQEIYNRFKEE